MEMATALAELGVTPASLDDRARQELDRDGYTVLPDVLSAGQLTAIRDRLAEQLAAEGERAASELGPETGADRLYNLVDKGPVFELCYTNPRVLACIAHVLGEFKLSSLNSRAALPGEGQQLLHADWGEPVSPGDYQVCNSIWLLDDFTADNGATRVVPGSHRSQATPGQSMPDPTAPHPDEVLVTGPAGAVVVFNSHLWHGGTRNRSDRPRRAMHCFFTRRGLPQQTDQRKSLRPQTLARLTPAARFILDV